MKKVLISENVKNLANEFAMFFEKMNELRVNGDYEQLSVLRSELEQLQKQVFDCIVEPYIPLSYEGYEKIIE